MSIINADIIRQRAAKLYEIRIQKLINELTEAIDAAVEDFNTYVETSYHASEARLDMCRDIVERFEKAGYDAYYCTEMSSTDVFITWVSTTAVPVKYQNTYNNVTPTTANPLTADEIMSALNNL